MLAPLDTISLSAGEFTWTDRQGVAELSDLQVPHGLFLPTAFRLRGRNGEKMFTRSIELKDAEGDVIAWVYVSTDGFRIDILND